MTARVPEFDPPGSGDEGEGICLGGMLVRSPRNAWSGAGDIGHEWEES